MGIVFGIATVLLLVALSDKSKQDVKVSTTGSWSPPALPHFVGEIIRDPNASKDDLAKAALQAKEAGYPKLAQALAKRITGGKNLIKSPWRDVSDSAWTRFASSISNGHKPTDISPKGFFGLFQLGVRRLVDLGVMTNPKSRSLRDQKTGATIRIWQGTWLIPEDKFLADPETQYKLFTKSMELYRSIVAEKYKQVLGLNIDGKTATLSGLLALAHSAGSEGMHKWLTNGDIRKKFTWVTDAYHKSNGIF